MATEPRADSPPRTDVASPEPPVVERNRRASRWLHAGFGLATVLLLATGGWLLLGHEGQPSILARATGTSDVGLHKVVGWALAAWCALAVVVWRRRMGHFVRESLRWERADLGWFARWPKAVLTGRFGRHEGDYDPGQRVANVLLAGGLLVLVVSGVALALLHGGPAFVWFHRAHVWATYVVTVMAVGHVLVASGVLPGYRGAWRAMHLGGRTPTPVARRLWPAWLERVLDTPGAYGTPERSHVREASRTTGSDGD
jgi:cytochrome b subunit of formate dehydrogenase